MPHNSDGPAGFDPAHVPYDYVSRSVAPPGLLGTDTSSVFAHTLERMRRGFESQHGIVTIKDNAESHAS